ncbi:MAG TPA: hypothetical protein VH762_13860 [Gemmatimonadaceae bacterium]|jgi:uncharacterized membrane protein YgcG
MDILVMLEESPENSSVLAHVNSVPATLDSERPSRDVVTLYGEPTVQSLALALAAVVRSQRAQERAPGIVRHLGIWADRGAVGDAAWRDAATGRLVSRDLTISIEQLQSTAAEFLSASGADLRLLVAGLQMPDWPEGTRRAISFSLSEPALAGVGADGGGGGSGGDAGDDGGGGGGGGGGGPDLLETYRSSAGLTYDNEGD